MLPTNYRPDFGDVSGPSVVAAAGRRGAAATSGKGEQQDQGDVARRGGEVSRRSIRRYPYPFLHVERQATAEASDKPFAVNAKGTFFTVQRLAPLLNDRGSVVFTTVAHDVVFPGLSAYSASKEAMPAFTQVLAAELLPRRIRVNSVAPATSTHRPWAGPT